MNKKEMSIINEKYKDDTAFHQFNIIEYKPGHKWLYRPKEQNEIYIDYSDITNRLAVSVSNQSTRIFVTKKYDLEKVSSLENIIDDVCNRVSFLSSFKSTVRK